MQRNYPPFPVALRLVMGLDFPYAALLVPIILASLFERVTGLGPIRYYTVDFWKSFTAIVPFSGELFQFSSSLILLVVPLGVIVLFVGLGVGLWERSSWVYRVNVWIYAGGAVVGFLTSQRSDMVIGSRWCLVAVLLLAVPRWLRQFRLSDWLG